MIVDRCTSGLNDKNIRTAYVFSNLNGNFSVGKLLYLCLAEVNIQVIADFHGNFRIGVARENLQFFWHGSLSMKMAGAGGFEPPNARIKTLCLTA